MKRYFYLFLSGILILLTGCKKSLDIAPPINRINAKTVFLEDATATAAVMGLYTKLANQTPTFSDGATTIWMGLASDEITYRGTDAEIIAFNTNKLTSSNIIVYRDFWRNPYEIIYQANACIEGLQNAPALTLSLKNQLLGEALTIRAFSYYYLVNFFGDVPLILNTDYELNALMPRTSDTEVMKQITTDLQAAIGLLTANYPSDGKIRINSFTAMALLTRAYLYQKEWANAEKTATAVMGSGKYSLESDLSKTFLVGSQEAIWQIAQPDNSLFNAVEADRLAVSLTGSTVPRYTISADLNDSFELGDKRKSAWTATKTVNGTSYQFIYKYKVRASLSAKTEHCIVFRLAELYLTRAEARARQNNMDGALADLNVIRSKAGLPVVKTSDQTAALSAILKEKRIECFAEFGQRWFDLKRNGLLNDAIAKLKPTWSTISELLPIPEQEINLNFNLKQNPGY